MRRTAAALLILAAASAGCAARGVPAGAAVRTPAATLASDLDALFTKAPFDTAVWSVKFERLRDGQVLYERTPRTLVMSASNMKIVTLAAAAEVLGWNHRFETRLVAEGDIRDGVLHGDLRVIGGGDPSIASANYGPAPLFTEWAGALRALGVGRITGRIIGDDNAFDDEGLGAGWSWDYAAAGYAAPVSALQYNEGVVVLRVRPGAKEGDPAELLVSPAGHGLEIENQLRTGPAGSNASIDVARLHGQTRARITGSVPAGGRQTIRTTSVDNPTLFFVEGFKLALLDSGIRVEGDAVDVDDVAAAAPAGGKLIAANASAPFAELAAYFMKVSQNLYGEHFLKAMGRTAGRGAGSLSTGRAVVRGVLEKWGIPANTYALFDGSGLSRYNEISASLVVTLLRKMFEDERHRGWFLASLPVGGHDGTLDSRMRNTALQGAVQAKTGTIANARALSGFLTAPNGERVIFSIIANNFLRPSSEVDAIAEGALSRVLREVSGAAPQPPQAPRR